MTRLSGTWPDAQQTVALCIATHERLASEAGKPLLIEEFGFPRDDEAYDPCPA